MQNVIFTQFRLGHLEIPGARQKGEEGRKRIKGTPIRKLQDALAEALQTRRPRRTWHLGKGSLVYDLVGSWLPVGVIGWMMGLQRQRLEGSAQKRLELLEEGSESSAQWEKVEQDL